MRRRLTLWAAYFYPSAWRKRYGDEFIATVEDMPAPGWAAVWDAWKGATAMQIRHGRTLRELALFSVAGLAVAWGVSLGIPDLYVSEVAIRSTAKPAALSASLHNVLSRPQLKALIEKHQLYTSSHSRLPLEDIIEKMKKDIHVSRNVSDRAPRALTVSFAYEGGAVAQRVTTDLAAALAQTGLYSEFDSASKPSPIYPNRTMIALSGMFAGAVLGFAWTAWKRRWAWIALQS